MIFSISSAVPEKPVVPSDITSTESAITADSLTVFFSTITTNLLLPDAGILSSIVAFSPSFSIQ